MNLGWIKGLTQTGKQMAKTGAKLIVDHAPGILMGMGTIGTGTAVWYAIKAGQEAVFLIDQAEVRKGDEERQKVYNEMARNGGEKPKVVPYKIPLTFREKVVTCWKVYIPAVGMALAGIGCFWGAHWVDIRRQAVLAGLYSTAEASLQEYQKKVIELMGEKQHEEIREAIAEDKAAQTNLPALQGGVGANDIWFNMYGKTFPSTYQKVKCVENEFNHKMLLEMSMSKAELMFMLDPSGEFMRPDKEDHLMYFDIDKLLVLHVTNPWGPIATITFEDKDGLEYLPKPNWRVFQ